MLNARALQTKLIQFGVSLTGDTVALPVAPAPVKGKGKGTGKGQGKSKGKSGLSEKGNNVGRIPSSSGICFNFARLGKCDKDACTFQHASSGQLRMAHGNESGDEKGNHEISHSK